MGPALSRVHGRALDPERFSVWNLGFLRRACSTVGLRCRKVGETNGDLQHLIRFY
jgi:hypothetical protein